MLAAGQVEQVKSALSRLVTSIEVHEDPRPGRKRPGAKLVVQGNLEALLQLTGAKATSGGSPGGIRTFATIQPQAREWTLQGRWYRAGSVASDQGQPRYALQRPARLDAEIGQPVAVPDWNPGVTGSVQGHGTKDEEATAERPPTQCTATARRARQTSPWLASCSASPDR
jgi:hypothetical protein